MKTELETQDLAERLVKNEVYYCVSSLIHELSQDEKYWDDLSPILCTYDYEEPAQYHIDEVMDLEELSEFTEMDISEYSEEAIRVFAHELSRAKGFHEFCYEFNVEPYNVEVYEHWIVSDFLADKIEENGGCVCRDFLGLTIWGRTTTGQAIYMDSIIQNVAIGLGLI